MKHACLAAALLVVGCSKPDAGGAPRSAFAPAHWEPSPTNGSAAIAQPPSLAPGAPATNFGPAGPPPKIAFYGAPILDLPPHAVLSGDLDGDGLPDLVQREGTYTIQISSALARGDGSFRLVTPAVPPLDHVDDARIGDLDCDGKLDLLLQTGLDTWVLARGHGDGTFAAPVPSAAAGYRPLVVDFNGDGCADLVGHADDWSVLVMLNDGHGNFSSQRTPTGYSPELAVADVDGDGVEDVIVASAEGETTRLVWMRGLGGGALGAPIAIADGVGRPAAGDFDGDGHTDVWAVSAGLNGFTGSVFAGAGDGTFRLTQTLPTWQQYPGAFVDLNHDGRLDMIDGTDVRLANAGCTFGERLASPLLAPLFADWNGDSRIDAMIGNAFAAGNGDGTFVVAASSPVPDTAYSIVHADLNRDGREDLAVAGGHVLLGDGKGRFATGPSLAAGSAIAAGDLNGDGNFDLVTVEGAARGTPGWISVELGAGDGTFAAPVHYGALGQEYAVAVADFDGDGHADVITAGMQLTKVAGEVVVLRGAGDGTLGPPLSYDLAQLDLRELVTADLNGDGRADVIASGGSSNLHVFLGRADGSLAQPVQYTSCSYPVLLAADLTGDGLVDVVCVDSDRALIFAGRGDGTLMPAQPLPVRPEVRSLIAADVDGDGLTDLVATGSEFAIYFGAPGGRLTAPLRYMSYNGSVGAVADFTGDGRLDVLSAGTGLVTLLRQLPR